MATAKMTIAERYTPIEFASGLMAGDSARFKAGYSADNAYLSTRDAYELTFEEETQLCADLDIQPRCWCDAPATRINEATDASAEHYTCDEHVKDTGYRNIPPKMEVCGCGATKASECCAAVEGYFTSLGQRSASELTELADGDGCTAARVLLIQRSADDAD